MEIPIGDIVSWFLQCALTVCGLMAVKVLSSMNDSIKELNIQVAELLIHKEHSDIDFERLEARVIKIEDNQI